MPERSGSYNNQRLIRSIDHILRLLNPPTAVPQIFYSTAVMPTLPTPSLSSGHLVTRTDNSTNPECTTATPGKYGRVDDYSACNAYYTYNPSFEAAILFTILFGILTIAHISQGFWYKKKFTWVIITGVLFELTSFVCRTLGSRNQQNVALATASQLLFLLAPLCKLSLLFTHPDWV
jgi:hypothetical protein